MKLLWAAISVIGLYLSACLVFGTGPIFLAYDTVSEIAGLFLGVAVFIGAYSAWTMVGRGFFKRAAVILVALVLLNGAVSSAFAASISLAPFIADQTTAALADSSGIIAEPSTVIFPGQGSCVLGAGNESSSVSTGYHILSYSRAYSASWADCKGLGYLGLETYASGIAASASASASLWWSTSGIDVPSTANGYALLSVILDLSINGWQTPAAGSQGTSQVVLQYAMKLVRDDGHQEYLFSRYFQNGVGFGGDYEPAYNSLLVESGHSYRLVVMFNATAYSRTALPTTAASTETCFGFPSACGAAPEESPNLSYCPSGVSSYRGICPYIEWEFANYNITRT